MAAKYPNNTPAADQDVAAPSQNAIADALNKTIDKLCDPNTQCSDIWAQQPLCMFLSSVEAVDVRSLNGRLDSMCLSEYDGGLLINPPQQPLAQPPVDASHFTPPKSQALTNNNGNNNSHSDAAMQGRVAESCTVYSRKVFIGGVSHESGTEKVLENYLAMYGKVEIVVPKSDTSRVTGYVYAIFNNGDVVYQLLQSCRIVKSSSPKCDKNRFYLRFSHQYKEVQIIPWITHDSCYTVARPSGVQNSEMKVFVGALHGLMTAVVIAQEMDKRFGNVIDVQINTDTHKYPIGSARVTFSQKESYKRAVATEFVSVKTAKFTKKIQVNPFIDDLPCSMCAKNLANTYCKNLQCCQYFCEMCWKAHEVLPGVTHHKVSKKSQGSAAGFKKLPEVLAKRVGKSTMYT